MLNPGITAEAAMRERQDEIRRLIDSFDRACRALRRVDKALNHDNRPKDGDGTTVIIPGSDTQPGWDQIAPPSDPDYTTGGEHHG